MSGSKHIHPVFSEVSDGSQVSFSADFDTAEEAAAAAAAYERQFSRVTYATDLDVMPVDGRYRVSGLRFASTTR